MNNLTLRQNEIIFKRKEDIIRITPCAENAIRFEAFPGGEVFKENFTLMPQEADGDIQEKERCVFMTVGALKIQLEDNGKVTFFKNGTSFLEELPELAFFSGFRHYEKNERGAYYSRVTFRANENEHFFGLGHEEYSPFDLKGCSFDMRHVNAKCTIPFVYSSLGYGFIWNNPAVGNIELSKNRTRFAAYSTKKIDYVVIAGNPKEVSQTLADLTGHAPVMPHWATGFWQSRLRYETQEDLLEVARRYKKENIPLSVIICDYFHWTEQGDYKFDPQYWTDVKSMTDELHEMGTRLVVSVWPTINESSENFEYMQKEGMLITTDDGSGKVFDFYGLQHEIDATNPKTREFVFGKLKENYLDNGVDGLWFDEAEPEIHPENFTNLNYHVGKGDEYGLIYPYYYSKMAYEGFKKISDDEPVTLTRCAYLGSQKYGALVWSGDIYSSFASLAGQVKAGLNMSICGIPWWNTDIGGFWGADTTNEEYRDLIVRWFQYGVFCPVMRVHGNRCRHGEKKRDVKEPTGDPNEIWGFGERNYPILKELILLRNRLRPYIEKHMEIASVKGWPVMRPMFFDFPEDETCYTLGEQYMFGDDILFAPIVNYRQTEKQVYLPEGEWVLTKDGKEYGAGWHTVSAEIDEFIAFVRKSAEVLSCF